MTAEPMPPAVRRLVDGLADHAERAERRRHQIGQTFAKVHGRPAVDEAELDTWLEEIRSRTRCPSCGGSGAVAGVGPDGQQRPGTATCPTCGGRP